MGGIYSCARGKIKVSFWKFPDLYNGDQAKQFDG